MNPIAAAAARLAPPPESDPEQGKEVFALYVRRLVGRAAQVCTSPKDFREIRRPLREVLQRVPALGGLSGKLSVADANQRIAEILHADCLDEAQTAALTLECAEILRGYGKLCEAMGKLRDHADEYGACVAMQEKPLATGETVLPAAAPAPAPAAAPATMPATVPAPAPAPR